MEKAEPGANIGTGFDHPDLPLQISYGSSMMLRGDLPLYSSNAYLLASPNEGGQHAHFDQLMHDEMHNGENTNPFGCI